MTIGLVLLLDLLFVDPNLGLHLGLLVDFTLFACMQPYQRHSTPYTGLTFYNHETLRTNSVFYTLSKSRITRLFSVNFNFKG